MDLASSCKDKLAYFRIKELKDVLAQLGLAKQGKKQDLVDRILSVFSDEQGSRSHVWAKKSSLGKEGLGKIIDDTYRKLQVHGATDLASKGQNGSSLSSMKAKDEVDFSFQLDMKIRCPCGSSLVTASMVKCEGRRCDVWQHMGCVIIPEKPMEGVQPEVPSCFYCEICRLSRADPFWESVAHPLFPVKMTVSNLPTDGSNPALNVEKTFQLSRADRDLLQKTEYDLQAWCILLNDKVTFRMQWPQYSDLQVNGVLIRTTNRPVSQLLGISGRDDGPAIKTCCKEGMNKISLTAFDARIFCIGVRIVRRRTVQQVLNLIPKESDGENFEEALARVLRCIGGGAAAENADSDSDLEVVADSVTVSLRCPMSGSRIKIAGRFKPCAHMGCFDLQTFVELNQRSRKWQCPICLKNYSLENMIIDPYFNRITLLMQDCGEDVNEIEVKPDGSWRAKNESERRDLAQWHSPNGSLCVTTDGGRLCESETLQQQIKEEFSSDEHTTLKIGIKRNHNGLWEVSKPEDKQPILSGNHIAERLEDNCQKVLPMSSSATGSYRDGEDPSVNQEGGGQFDFSITNGNEHDSAAFNFGTTYGAVSRIPSVPLEDADVIILSDSEEEDAIMRSHQTVYYTGPDDDSGIPLPIPPAGATESYPEDHNQCPGLFTSNNDVFEMALWSQAGSDLHLFGTGTDVSDALVDVENTPASFPVTINGYGPSTNTIMGTVLQVEDPLAGQSNTETDGLVHNRFLFDTDDPSLQNFLPSHPAGVPVQMDAQNQTEISNGICSEDWISLRLGGGGSESAERHSSNLRKQPSSNEGRMGISDNINYTGSLLQSLNNDDDVRRRPFSHPRQPRSVRPRFHLSL